MCYNKGVMGKCIKSIVLSVIAAVFAVTALSSPVFATPDTGNDNGTDTTVVTDEPDVNNPTDSDDNDNTDGEEEDEESSTPSCYDQVGSLGWIICPGAGLFGNVIDGAYDLLTQIIEVNPIPTDNTSPTFVVWEYFKDITNSLFIIFLLVIIISQLTGFGINNYGIKKALPRIIVSAILVNLSYIICTIAVDLSNILGNAFQAFFVNVQNIAIENGAISDVASTTSVAGIVTAMLGIGTAGTIAAFAAFGGVSGVIWMLLPILLSGLIAVISAVVTMAARQALIYLLVMISPLALIAYMLPNTEKWYKKWYATLAQMLFFYPMFSILYGASQLAGLVIITSATNWLGVVLGIAVKILPLFLSIPLMRMSNSILGKVSGVIDRATRTPMGAFGRYSLSKQANAKQAQLNKRNPIMPSTRLAQYLERQRAKREFDTNYLAASNKDKNLTYAMTSMRNRNGKYNRRGLRYYENERQKLDNATARLNVLNDFDEGFEADGSDKRVRTRDLSRVRAINDDYKKAIVDSHTAESRKRVVAHNNTKTRAELIRKNIREQGNEIHERVLNAFNIDAAEYATISNKKANYEAAVAKQEALQKYNAASAKQRAGQALTPDEVKTLQNGRPNSLSTAEQSLIASGGLTAKEKAFYDTGSQAINFTLSDAIAARRKVNNEAKSVYYELYDDSPAGLIPGNALTEALKSGDYNSMNAAIAVMAKRGDHKDIMEILRDNSKNLIDTSTDGSDDNDAIRFQKEINDACLALKADNPVLWAWAKSNMIRRGKYNHDVADGKTPKLAAFIDFDSFVNGSHMDGDTLDLSTHVDASGNTVYNNTKDKSTYDMIAMESILTNVRDGKLFAGADRTMYNYFLSAGKDGLIDNGHYIFTDIKHLRASACSGMMDGEQLASFNNYMTYGYTKNGDNTFFDAHRGEVHANLVKYFKDMTAGQLASVKTATLVQFNDALIAINGDAVQTEGGMVSKELLDVLENQRASLQKPNMSTQRANMNQSVRKMLGIKLQ